jgi:hypothetical protein
MPTELDPARPGGGLLPGRLARPGWRPTRARQACAGNRGHLRDLVRPRKPSSDPSPACQGIAHALRCAARPGTGVRCRAPSRVPRESACIPGRPSRSGPGLRRLAQPCDRRRWPWKVRLGVVQLPATDGRDGLVLPRCPEAEVELASGLTRSHAVAEQLAWWCTARPEQEVRSRGHSKIISWSSKNWAVSEGLTLVPLCRFARSWLEHHPGTAPRAGIQWGVTGRVRHKQGNGCAGDGGGGADSEQQPVGRQ